MKRVFLILTAIVIPFLVFSQSTTVHTTGLVSEEDVKAPPLPCITPTVQVSAFTATATGSFTMDLAWLRGDGDNVIVLAHEAAAVDADPVSGTTYTANAAFSSGTQIGTGNYVVYIGTGNAVTVTGLDPGTAYHFAAYEFLNTDVCYLIPGVTANATTGAAAPTISTVSPNNFFADKGAQLTITGTYMNGATVTLAGVTGSIVSNDGTTIVVDFPAGFYINNTLTVSTGVLPNATSTVTVNTRNVIPVGGGTDPHATIQDALDGLFAWFGTSAFTTATAGYLAGAKTIEVYNGTYTDIVTPNITLGTTAAENLIIQNAAGQAPVINATGHNYGFYIGALNYVQVIGFTVHSATLDLIYTEGDNNTIRYNRCYGSTGGTGIMVYNAPNAIVSNNLVYNNNQFGIRITASNAVTVKNNTLADNGNEAKGPPLPGIYTPAQLYVESGTGTLVQNNIFYAKSGTYVFTLLTETGVTVSSDYNTYFRNGNTELVFYNGVMYTNLTEWAGNGAGANDLETDPLFVTNSSDFHIRSIYESYHSGEWPPLSTLSGTWTVDASTSPALDAGNPADAYINEPSSGNRINQGAYGNTVQASKSTVCTYPTIQATNFSATPDITSIDISWTRGNGDAVIVLAHQGAPVDANPVDGTTYTANAAFGSGTQIGTGNYVVYIGTLTAETVTGLTSNTTYHFAIYEYSDAEKCYLVPGLTGSSTTLAASPTITTVSPDNFFADKGAQLTITGSYLTGATVTIAGVTGGIVSNDGSTIVVDFPAGLYINNTLTVSTGVGTDATTTVTVNTRNVIPVAGGTDPHATIQEALDGLFAWFGTSAFTTATAGYLAGAKTIEVYNGTYTDIVTPNITLGTTASENLIIQNAAGQAPVIDATGHAYGFYIGALNYVQVIGFTVHSATIDLIYTEGDNNTIRYNRCYGSTGGTGIMLNNANTASVSNNLVYDNNQFGIRITGSNSVSLKNNTLVNNASESKGPPLPGIYKPAQLYVESGTGTLVQNNIFYAKTGSYIFTLLTETGVTVSSDYNTYFKNGNAQLVFYNGVLYADLAAWTGNGAGANDLESDPLFVTNGSDFHIQSVYESYHGGEWPPLTALAGVWTVDLVTSPALDGGNPADAYVNEPVSGGVINQGAYGNTVQASKSNGFRWDGSTSTDWRDVTNWTPEAIPTASDDVTVPDGCPNYPVIDDGALLTAVCNNISIGALSSVTVAPNGQMTISGTVNNVAGAAGMVVKSDATGDGSLIVHNDFPATVERYIVGNQWHMIFPGVSAVPTSVFTAEGAYTNYNFYSYNEPNEDYWNATTVYGTTGWTYETGAPTVRTDKGILFNRYNMASKTYIETGGNLSSSDKVFNVSYTLSTVLIENGVTATRDYFDGWNMAGNPYTGAVDWNLVTLNGIESGIYYFDGSNYRYYMQGGDGSQLPPYDLGISLNGGSRYIPAGQGFMVKVENIGNTTFTIPQTARVHNDQAFYKSTVTIPNLLRFQLEKDGFTDESVVRTLPVDATDEHDSQYDAYKMYAWDHSKPQIYSMTNDLTTQFAINSLPEFEQDRVIPIGLYVGVEGNYTIRATENNFEGYSVWLKDKEIQKTVPFMASDSYTFESVIGTFAERFELVFEKSTIGVEDHGMADCLVYPNPNEGRFYVSLPASLTGGTVMVTDISGKMVYLGQLNSSHNEIKLPDVNAGIYFVKIEADGRSFMEKVVIQ
jgi:parallel beta-helix repeat protein